MDTVRVTIPATSANLGPGFDSLGLALGLHNVVEARTTTGSLVVEVHGEGTDELTLDRSNMVVHAALAVYDACGKEPPGLYFKLTNRIPPGGGLGSSAAALVGGLLAANGLLGSPLDEGTLLDIAIDLEGHPDNVTAAMLGGLVVSSIEGNCGLIYQRVRVPALRAALALPSIRLSTKAQRAKLPQQVALRDAASNIGRAALVVQALQQEDYDLLGKAMCDCLHEPYRRHTIPGFEQVDEAARREGAAAVAISGAGPAMIAFAPDNHEAIAEAMGAAFTQATGSAARTWVLTVDQDGASASWA